MKKQIISFVLGAVIFGTVGAFATSYVANPASFKVLVNGKEFVSDPPVLVVEGSTYLPLRAMGDALGVPVNWNDELKQAEVGNGTAYGKFNEDEIISNLNTTTYTWNKSGHYYLAMVIKNNTNQTFQLDTKVYLKNASGDVVGAKNDSEHVIDIGQEYCVVFSNNEMFSDFSYEYTVKKSVDYYSPIVSQLSPKITKSDKKVILEVKNDGTKDANFVEYAALFFENGKAIDYSSGYVVDSDSQIKAGKTEIKEASIYSSFDDVKVYFAARANK